MEKRDLKIEEFRIFHCVYKTRLSNNYKNRKTYTPVDPMKITCVIPGTVVEVLVSVGDLIDEGADILILEAMKMKNRVRSTASGRIKSVNVSQGDRVTKGRLLVEME